jgi:hypothetical protein
VNDASLDSVLNRPLPLRVLIDEAIHELRRHFSSLYPGIAIPYALALVPLTFFYFRSMGQITKIGAQPALADAIKIFVNAGVVFAGMMAVHLLAYTATLEASLDAVSGRPVRIWKSWLFGVRPRVLGTFLLVMICWLFASLFCIVPGIYVSLLLSFAAPVMVEERRFGPAAMKRSARLLRFESRLGFGDNPIVKVFLLMLVAYLLSMAVSMLLQVPLAVAQQILVMRKATEGQVDPSELMETMAWFQVPAAGLGALATVALYLYMNLGMALLFFDVRRRREGRDLEEALDVLEASPIAGGAA